MLAEAVRSISGERWSRDRLNSQPSCAADSIDDLGLGLLAAFELSSDILFVVDGVTFDVILANRAACDFARAPRSEIVGNDIRRFLCNPARELSAMPFLGRTYDDLGALRQSEYGAIWLHSEVDRQPVRIAHCHIGDEGLIALAVRAMTAAASSTTRTGETESRDELTGLANRSVLWSRMNQALKLTQESGYRFAVMFLDLDGFKEINDTFGHLVGDTLLQEVAHRLVKCARPSDLVARYGGDEFIVLVDNIASEEDTFRIEERFREGICGVIALNERHFTFSVSIGSAIANPQTKTPNELIRAADEAMYRQKAASRWHPKECAALATRPAV